MHHRREWSRDVIRGLRSHNNEHSSICRRRRGDSLLRPFILFLITYRLRLATLASGRPELNRESSSEAAPKRDGPPSTAANRFIDQQAVQAAAAHLVHEILLQMLRASGTNSGHICILLPTLFILHPPPTPLTSTFLLPPPNLWLCWFHPPPRPSCRSAVQSVLGYPPASNTAPLLTPACVACSPRQSALTHGSARVCTNKPGDILLSCFIRLLRPPSRFLE